MYLLVGVGAPRYAIIKIYKNSWEQKLRFYDFSNCVFSYWCCTYITHKIFQILRGPMFAPIHPPLLSKIKNDHKGHFLFWWEWVDSNHLRLKPTDLQSAPALQLRRTPRTLFGAGSGTRTRTSSLEGLRTSPCTMPAINPRAPLL